MYGFNDGWMERARVGAWQALKSRHKLSETSRSTFGEFFG